MRRVAVVVALLVVVLGSLLAWRLRSQAALARGPAGGSGEIEGTEVALSARISARLVELRVRKGQEVGRGDLLALLDCDDPRAQLAEAEARLAAAQAQARAAGASVEASRRAREAAAAGEEASRAQAEALAAQRDAARRQAGRLESVAGDVAAANRDQTQASAQALASQTSAAMAQAAASAGQARAAGASMRASSAQALAAEAQVQASQAALARARLLAAECEIRAPRSGVVEELPHEPGELVGAGQTLVLLVDLDDVKATFYLPNAEIGRARPGARAVVVADAWPGERFEGEVATVAARAEFTPRNIQTRTDRDRLVYPVEVALRNPGRKLRPGMPVQVALPGTER
jgi:HlyD family secretion protein